MKATAVRDAFAARIAPECFSAVDPNSTNGPETLPNKAWNMLREFNWTGILFGSGAGLVASYVLFVISGPLGTNVLAQIFAQVIGFVTAGFIAGRFSLFHVVAAGRIAALILFFAIATATIAAGAGANVFGLLLLGLLAISGGAAGAALAERSRSA